MRLLMFSVSRLHTINISLMQTSVKPCFELFEHTYNLAMQASVNTPPQR